MPAFFVPGLSREEAEKVYAAFRRPTYPPIHPTARLYSIDFRQSGFDCTATVGEEMTGWPDRHGTVLGVIESTNHIMIYTERSAVRGDIVNVESDKVTAREYFDDYPAN
jgi:hypothetical protein